MNVITSVIIWDVAAHEYESANVFLFLKDTYMNHIFLFIFGLMATPNGVQVTDDSVFVSLCEAQGNEHGISDHMWLGGSKGKCFTCNIISLAPEHYL